MDLERLAQPLIHKIRRGECILFAGAGLSAQATDSRGGHPPTWNELLRQMVQWAAEHGVDFGGDERDLLEAIRRERHLVVAQELQDRLGHRFAPCLNELLAPDRIRPGAAHKLAVQIGWRAILTSNYDRLLEHAYSQQHGHLANVVTPTKPIRALDLLREGEPFIFKVHGDIEDPNRIVLGHWDYAHLLYGDPSYAHVLEVLFSTTTVLFVGFGARDPDLMSAIDRMATMFRSGSQEHYLLVPENAFLPFERRRLAADRRLQCLTYEEDASHSKLVDFLEVLLRETQSSAGGVGPERTAPVPSLPEQMDGAQEMWLLAVTGGSLVKRHAFFLKSWPGRRIRLILANPDGNGLSTWGRQYQRDVRTEARAAAEFFIALNGRSRPNGLPPLYVEVRYHDLPRSVMSLADPMALTERSSAVVATQSYGRSSEERPKDWHTPTTNPAEFAGQVATYRHYWEAARRASPRLEAGGAPRTVLNPNAGTPSAVAFPLFPSSMHPEHIVVPVGWIQELFRHAGAGGRVVSPDTDLRGWPRLGEMGLPFETRRDVEEKAFCRTVSGDLGPRSPSAQVGPSLSLAELRPTFAAESVGVLTELMRYPELVALVDGADFRFGFPLLIRDFNPITRGQMPELAAKAERFGSGPTRFRIRNCELCGSADAEVRHVIGVPGSSDAGAGSSSTILRR